MGLYRAGSDDAVQTNENGHYTVHYCAKDGVAVFGVYQKSTPHRIEFSLAEEVSNTGYELVASAFANNGIFTFTTRHGAVSFTKGGPVETASIPSVECDSLLAVKAPLAFFA